MTSKARVQELVDFVEAGRIIDAMNTFYHSDVTMQDNLGSPVIGLDANRSRLLESMKTIQEVREHRARRVIVDGDHAVIHWSFRFTTTEGARLDFDQFAVQEWRGSGDDARIINERFVYDSASILAQEPTHSVGS